MTLRVSTEEGQTITTIRLEGELTVTGVDALRGACESVNQPLRLDLSGLRSADPEGVRELQSLSDAGAELHGASPYISQLLLEAST